MTYEPVFQRAADGGLKHNIWSRPMRCVHPEPGESEGVTAARLAFVSSAHAAFMVNRAGPCHAHHPNEDVGPHPAPRPTG